MKCPTCGLDAEIWDEFTLASTSGICIMRKWRCLNDPYHWWHEPEYIDVDV